MLCLLHGELHKLNSTTYFKHTFAVQNNYSNCPKILFALRFRSPVNPMESCRARSVYLTISLLGRLCPLRS